jgi:hypothetical protein
MHETHHSTSVSWAAARQATLHCLTGCAIGEVLGMVLGTALGLPDAGTVVLSVALAFVFGYALTMRGVLRAGHRQHHGVVDDLHDGDRHRVGGEGDAQGLPDRQPGAQHAALFWLSLAGSLALAFVLTVPVNRWLMSRGRGHAVVHAHHH